MNNYQHLRGRIQGGKERYFYKIHRAYLPAMYVRDVAWTRKPKLRRNIFEQILRMYKQFRDFHMLTNISVPLSDTCIIDAKIGMREKKCCSSTTKFLKTVSNIYTSEVFAAILTLCPTFDFEKFYGEFVEMPRELPENCRHKGDYADKVIFKYADRMYRVAVNTVRTMSHEECKRCFKDVDYKYIHGYLQVDEPMYPGYAPTYDSLVDAINKIARAYKYYGALVTMDFISRFGVTLGYTGERTWKNYLDDIADPESWRIDVQEFDEYLVENIYIKRSGSPDPALFPVVNLRTKYFDSLQVWKQNVSRRPRKGSADPTGFFS